MAVTAINSAVFWDMTQCNVIELPTFTGKRGASIFEGEQP